jgi:hypothetical protein
MSNALVAVEAVEVPMPHRRRVVAVAAARIVQNFLPSVQAQHTPTQ